LIFQASQLGLGSQWLETKKAYVQANALLGDIVKVTPTSKVVGDLAQFMVSNKLDYNGVIAKAKELDFPESVLEFFEGYMGQPYGGFPEPLRSDVLRGRRKMTKRPGLYLEPIDFAKVRKELKEKYNTTAETDIASYVMVCSPVVSTMLHANGDHSTRMCLRNTVSSWTGSAISRCCPPNTS
jgi:pyruvate carboxylase